MCEFTFTNDRCSLSMKFIALKDGGSCGALKG